MVKVGIYSRLFSFFFEKKKRIDFDVSFMLLPSLDDMMFLNYLQVKVRRELRG